MDVYIEKEIGLYYLQSRYYDAGVGRFVNKIKEKRLNMKVSICGIKLNLSMNIAGFLISTIYSYIKTSK